MSLSKSIPVVAVRSELPESILSTTVNEVTGRRRFCDPETGLPVPSSRMNVTCMVCGKVKQGRGPMCRACYQGKRRVTVTLRCCFCGQDFDRLRCDVEKAERRGHSDVYCSKVCSNAHHAVKHSARCPVCNGAKLKANKYCSRACAKVVRDQAAPFRQCPWCGETFHPASWKTVYCGKACADAAHATRMRGEGNSNYKTGTSYAKWYHEMREVVLDRDGHQCAACGAAQKLLVHHIDGDVRNNVPENLVALCMTCHAVHHKSAQTPFAQLAEYAATASRSMTSKLKERSASLLTAYSSTTV